MTRWTARATWIRGGLGGALAILGAGFLPVEPSGAQAVAGSAGTDTSLPLTASAVTVRGQDEFDDLEVTVNQTEDLGNQAISITWTGGEPTVRAGGAAFAEHFLQIMQCWSEPGASSPPPEQCEFGATDGVHGGRNQTLFSSGGFADDRVVARGDFEEFDADEGVLEEATNWQWKPFRSVTGETIAAHVDTDFSPAVESGNYWLNPFFGVITTNEIAGARTRADGTGEELFEVVTGLESSGLGCGQAVLARDGGAKAVPQCWLVIVPRGAAADENDGTIGETPWEGGPSVMTSPLSRHAWANRIQIPLEFNPIDTACELNEDERRIVGSELLLRAVSSWQPVLCATDGLPPYAYASVGDSSARLQLVSGAMGAPGMAVTSRPLDANAVQASNPVTYAPLTLSSIVIGFNVERIPDVETTGSDVERLRGVRIAELNLTPRLVAKLLTQSYTSQVLIGEAVPDDEAAYEWIDNNPAHLDQDPDFLRFNPEFELLKPLHTKNIGGLVLAAGTSDAARQVWEWIVADPEARSWLDGEPDEFGMVVNPVYGTTAEANANGIAFGEPVPETFPKSDPNCYHAPPQGPGGRVVPPVLCGTDWFPYGLTFRDAAQRARAANDGARTTLDTDATTPERVWRANPPQPIGTRSILSLVDSPTAIQYGLQTARLSRAGDNGDDREFVAADADAMTAAVEAMVPSGDPDVLISDPLEQPADAYPLTTLTYAAVTPLSLDLLARAQYAAFIAYAIGPGQEPGLEIGQLPLGYTELPDPLKIQAIEAALTILDPSLLQEPDAATTTTTTSPPAAIPVTPGGGSSSPSASSASPPVSSRGTPAASPPVVDGQPTPEGTSTTMPNLTSSGVTPVSSVGGGRFVLPVLGALVLVSMLGALEITKRPRRATGPASGSASAVVLVGLAVSLGSAVAATSSNPAAAQELDAGDLHIVDPRGRALDGGGSTTEFTLEPSGDAQCPGDSANDGYRIYSFMVPVATAAEDVIYDGLGPTPQIYERYEDFRMPLYDIFTRDYAAGLTAERDEPGGPGAIVDIPTLSFHVYREGEMPFGEYRVGLVCTLLNEIERYWDTEIVVSADEDDLAGFRWRVTGGSSSPASSGAPTALLLAVAGGFVAVVLLIVPRLRARSRASAPLELP